MRGGSTLRLEFPSWKLPLLIVFVFKGVNFQKHLFTPPSRWHPRSFQLVSERGSHLKLQRREKKDVDAYRVGAGASLK